MWTVFNTKTFKHVLGLDKNTAFTSSQIEFPVSGTLHDNGLSVAGFSAQYGAAELWAQDSSILGFTAGNAIASAHDFARFFFELLGPRPSILSAKTVEAMQKWQTLNAGWKSGFYDYGTGLMLKNVSPKQSQPDCNLRSRSCRHQPFTPLRNATASYVGHPGDTYGFQSDSGYFSKYSAALSVVVNQDTDPPSSFITCQALQLIARHFGDTEDLGCKAPRIKAMYECRHVFDQKVCVQADCRSNNHCSSNMTRSQCEAECPLSKSSTLSSRAKQRSSPQEGALQGLIKDAQREAMQQVPRTEGSRGASVEGALQGLIKDVHGGAVQHSRLR